MMELEPPKEQSQKRNSGTDDASRRKKRRSYSSVAEAWFETLSEAIQDGTNNSDSTTIESPQTPQRKQRPRRNAFVIHMDAEPAFLEGDDHDSPLRHPHPPESPPPLVPEIVLDVSIASEIENLELGQ
eukprot:CAMPEP_0113616848 /NCGR_PEP_ID=MMETSP0017_2-20120614/8458_1 /TAXON_ID=2856 /ORGANISM="Cylindrotheca closterium" /LENGTH=127 /DNA_ID=CAMNT_0000526189 /DNA_START=304 /DNA_END=687 /DNA_ORIENTATION=- /assembly_acc=CAM_ASM_000147